MPRERAGYSPFATPLREVSRDSHFLIIRRMRKWHLRSAKLAVNNTPMPLLQGYPGMQGVIGDSGAAGEQVKLILCTGQVYTIVAPSYVKLNKTWIRKPF